MRVFVTGATGFIGSAVVKELLQAGHDVVGLARSDEKAEALLEAGAEAVLGSLENPSGLQQAAADADGVIHLAFNHDFSMFAENCEQDRRVIEALGAALVGTDKPLIVTSGSLVGQSEPGRPVRESDVAVDVAINPRAASEEAAAVAGQGVNVSVVRLSQVHDPLRQGLITFVIGVYRDKGTCAYVGDGANGFAAVHIDDAARLYRLALEKAEPGARYHAVGEEAVSAKRIAEIIGKHVSLPVSSIAPGAAEAFFGWLGMMIGRDGSASSAWTREALGWEPAGPGLLVDLDQGCF